MPSTEEAGRRLERHIRGVLSQSTRLRTITDLIEASGVSRNSIYAWFAGEQEPGGRSMAKVAEALDLPVAELWRVYQGQEEPAPELVDVVRDMVEVVADLTVRMDQLVSRLDALVSATALALAQKQLDPEVERIAVALERMKRLDTNKSEPRRRRGTEPR